MDNYLKNGSGYSDPTAYTVIKKNDESQRFYNLLHTIWYICNIAGFKLENRLVLVDKRTGKVWI